jgi:hypothetical protein
MSNRNNDLIKKAIQRIALQGHVDPSSGVWHDSARIIGYVAKIHDDESDELFGTVDVQEYNTRSFVQEENDVKFGYHEGVYLSALQNNKEGYLIIPKLYSEVTIALDPESRKEYVVMFSHVDLIQLDSHEQIRIGVREREEFDNDEDGDDIDELKLTGISTNIELEKDSITTTVVADKDAKNTVTQIMDADGLKQTIGEDKSSQTMTQKEIILEHDKANMTLDDSQAKIEMGKSAVIAEDGTVYVGSKSGTDDAVLGQQLASILSELVGYLGQMMTPTMMGPQPPANVLGSFISLKAKIQSFASSHSGFLTQKVQIQK